MFFPAPPAAARQSQATLRVLVRADMVPVEDAEIVVNDLSYRTDVTGTVAIPVRPGLVEVTVLKEGFVPVTTSLTVAAGAHRELVVELQSQPVIDEEVTVVAATRTDRRLDDQPLRVEVLGREEIEEKMLMTPGDIVMMLNEMGGMRVQATSPSLGAASVRIQGMRGRYTRVLSDGLPLFGEVGGLGLLQIPPMDLGQVEVIKGVASALYGAGAMGGVINLVSRRPSRETDREFLLNRSTRGATDAVAYLAAPLAGGWSASLLGGGHFQETADVDDDGWADLPGYTRGVLRPRVFWTDGRGQTLFATAGITRESREGGTVEGRALEATGAPHREALDTAGYDAGIVGQLIAGRSVVTARVAAARRTHDHLFGDLREHDRHDTLFAELAVRRSLAGGILVAGAAIERDAYRPREASHAAYTFTVPGAFLQYDVDLTRRLSMSSSARLDRHSAYGTFVSPRISALARFGRWSSRVSAGTGFSAPTPLTEDTEAAGLSRLRIERPLLAERGLSASVDVSRADGPLSWTATLFASRVIHPLHVDRSDAFVLRTLSDPARVLGVELLGTFRRAPYALTATYTYVRARETVDGRAQDIALTPRRSAGIVAMWEEEDAGRIGVEWYYTGRQRLEENPYRARSVPYMIVGVLAEKRFGRVRFFINGENLTGVRQTRWDPLLRRTRGLDGRWTVDAWAPLDGRTFNGGVRLAL
jgi:iron complex outermembrane receptor protein